MKNKSIIFDFLFYDYEFDKLQKPGYLKECKFDFSEDGKEFVHLMKAEANEQNGKDFSWIMMKDKKKGEKIYVFNCSTHRKITLWPDDININVPANIMKKRFNGILIKRSYMRVIWHLPHSCKYIMTFKIRGSWKVQDRFYSDDIFEIYTMDIKI